MSRARLGKRKGVVSPREAINLVEPKHHMALIGKVAVVLFTVAGVMCSSWSAMHHWQIEGQEVRMG